MINYTNSKKKEYIYIYIHIHIVKYKVTLVRFTTGHPAVGLRLNSYCLEFFESAGIP